MTRHMVITGASSGIGAAAARHHASRPGRLLTVSRRSAAAGEWVAADLTTTTGVAHVAAAVGDQPLDAVLHCAGSWEADAFTTGYRFEDTNRDDIERVIATNLLAPILLLHALLPALRRSRNPKVIVIGALSGLDNYPAREVANSASKFGLRGMAHALRNELRADDIGVTVINPGNVATPEVLADLEAAGDSPESAIPLHDLLAVIDCVLALSPSTYVKEIQLPAMADEGA